MTVTGSAAKTRQARSQPAIERRAAQLTKTVGAWLATLVLACPLFPSPQLPQTMGEPANLVLKDLQGRQQALEAYRGAIVVVNFWATWCVPCREEMPLLVAFQQGYAARGVQVIGASADDESTQKKIPGFARRLKINFPIWVGATTADMQRLGLGEALPATAILDRDGQIAARILGALAPGDLESRVDWLLGDRNSPPPPALVKHTQQELAGERAHRHEKGEEHEHGAVGLEGASTVPS
jgi:thiol-disulfide isomerase/thioredoxin